MERFLKLYTSDHENSYIYDRKKKRFLYVHPILREIITLFECHNKIIGKEDISTILDFLSPYYEQKDIIYYYKKYCHWVSNGIYNHKLSYNIKSSIKINPMYIKKQLANTPQIVFEVTDSCNLQCYYCGYGQLYEFYDKRDGINLNKKKAFSFINHMVELWNSPFNTSANREVCISFYGGEPLLNMKLIIDIIEYISSLDIPNIKFYYSMTTNGILLKKHIDLLVKYDFHLLISLDGNKENNKYRRLKNKMESFDYVMDNILSIKEKYPDYFKKRINFNSVLHNRNSVSEIYLFIKKNFGKVPMISELNTMGVKPEHKTEFNKTYRNLTESLYQGNDSETIEHDMFILLPNNKSLVYFLHRYTDNIYYTYSDFFTDKKELQILPTGTCFPFSRKVFITTNGKILQCERISHKYYLGTINETGVVNIDYKNIAKKYHDWYNTLYIQCTACSRLGNCPQCMFYINDTNKTPQCPNFATINKLTKDISTFIYSLENDSKEYKRITENISIY